MTDREIANRDAVMIETGRLIARLHLMGIPYHVIKQVMSARCSEITVPDHERR